MSTVNFYYLRDIKESYTYLYIYILFLNKVFDENKMDFKEGIFFGKNH